MRKRMPWMRTMTLCLGLGLLAGGCAGSAQLQIHTRDASDDDALGSDGNKAELRVTLSVYKYPNPEEPETKMLIGPEERLHTGDRISFGVSVSKQAYLYLIKFNKDGSPTIIFPNTDAPNTQQVGAVCEHLLPSRGPVYLQEPAGIENLRLVATLLPLAEVDRHLYGELRLSGNPAAKPAQPSVMQCPEVTDKSARGTSSHRVTAQANSRGIAESNFRLRHEP